MNKSYVYDRSAATFFGCRSGFEPFPFEQASESSVTGVFDMAAKKTKTKKSTKAKTGAKKTAKKK